VKTRYNQVTYLGKGEAEMILQNFNVEIAIQAVHAPLLRIRPRRQA
jgi:hypothetical protein